MWIADCGFIRFNLLKINRLEMINLQSTIHNPQSAIRNPQSTI
jgi:hypothetical protein